MKIITNQEKTKILNHIVKLTEFFVDEDIATVQYLCQALLLKTKIKENVYAEQFIETIFVDVGGIYISCLGSPYNLLTALKLEFGELVFTRESEDLVLYNWVTSINNVVVTILANELPQNLNQTIVQPL